MYFERYIKRTWLHLYEICGTETQCTGNICFNILYCSVSHTLNRAGGHCEQFISYHRHMSSHFSFVYYPQADDQGNLFLLDDDAHKVGLNIPKRDPYFTKWDNTNYGKSEYPAETGNIIIFPSMMFHESGKNTKEKPRISISGDIMLTMKEGVKSEHNLPSPNSWFKI